MCRTATLVILLATLNGCIGWHRIEPPMVTSLRAESGPHKVRVQFPDSTSLTLRGATADSVSVMGYHDVLAGRFMVIPLDSVRSVQKQRFRFAPVLLVGFVLLGLAADGFADILRF